MRRLRVACGAVACVIVVAASLVGPVGSAASDTALPFVRDPRSLSSGARAWLFGPQQSGPGGAARHSLSAPPSLGTNADANDPSKDLAGGQSEAAIAADGKRVLVAWNDASALFWTDSTDRIGSLTGLGASTDGGRTFTDLIGLRNANAHQRWFGDPSIVAVGQGHFLVSGLYLPRRSGGCGGRFELAVEHVHVAPTGQATLGLPVVAIGSARCSPAPSIFDKDFMAFDPITRTLALSYARYTNANGSCGLGQIEVVTAHVPDDPALLGSPDFSPPIVIHTDEGCAANVLNQGAYPVVSPSGNVYVAWERNLLTNLTNGDPYVYIMAAAVRAGDTFPSRAVVVTANQENASSAGGVKSLDAVFLAGYNRGQGNDFPRVAWNEASGRLVVVWNDASRHPLGDIWLKTLNQGLTDTATSPVQKVNDDDSYALHFLPAVTVAADGALCTSWYDRRAYGADSSLTAYMGECRAQPHSDGTDFTISTGPTDWSGTSTFIAPNFGDYTDAASSGPYVFYAWSDGRLGTPQPFVDRAPSTPDG